MNVNLLRSKMALKGHKDRDLGNVLNVKRTHVYKKLKGSVDFSRKDIQIIINEYELTPKEIQEIFFN